MIRQQKKIWWWILIGGAVGLAMGAVGIFWYLWYQDQKLPVCTEEKNTEGSCQLSEKTFVIKSGEGPIVVAENLLKDGLIKSELIFRLYLKFEAPTDDLQAGVTTLNNMMSLEEVIKVLISPPEQVSITVLPGWRREEIAEYLTKLGLLENFDAEEFLELSKDDEGYLWADTYYVFATADAEDIYKLLRATFEEKTAELRREVSENSDLSWAEIVTLASILQREAKTSEQMKMISQIIRNRLEDGMKLQLCATAQYAIGKESNMGNEWWNEPSLEDTQYKSDYNTYVTAGLPPGPIAEISMRALEAAIYPTENDYFFYLHDDKGEIHYAKTAAEHSANKEKYL